MTNPSKFVIYRRVSTTEQGRSGLGLEAQSRDINNFLTSSDNFVVLGEFTDVMSGKDAARPQFQQACRLAVREKAVLLVSKLDRLSRDVADIATLMKTISFKVATMPDADVFQLHIYAALAEQERKMISIRTKDGLQSAKLRGVSLGGHRDGALDKANATRSRKADENATRNWCIISPLLSQGLSTRVIAARLNDSGMTTATGAAFDSKAISRIIKRMEAQDE